MSGTYEHNFKRVIWSPPTPIGKDRFHCSNCDSTVQFPAEVTEHEVNQLVAYKIKHKFPCINDNEVELEVTKLDN